jgi:hypothetical protein
MYETVILESLREGIEDSKIISTLKKEINEHPGDLANEAQNYLNTTLNNISSKYSNYNGDSSSSYVEDQIDGSPQVFVDLGGEANDYWTMDKIRHRMLNYIVSLNQQPELDQKEGDDEGSPDGGDDGGGGDSGDTTNPENDNQINEDQLTNPGTCEELWQCSSWGECINGEQIRECEDIKFCGTQTNKPETTKRCSTQTESPMSQLRLDKIFASSIATIGGLGIIGFLVARFLLIRNQKIKNKEEK